MEIYINSISAISPQNTFLEKRLPDLLDNEFQDFLQVIPPVYKDYIQRKDLRRMSKLMKIGLVSGIDAIQNHKNDTVDSIIIGSGQGNKEDTSKFLNNVLNNNERLLVPTSFVQSTNNIIGGQLALKLKNHKYNSSYIHENIAFESCLLDAILQFELKSIKTVLVGGVDVTYGEDYEIKKSERLWKESPQKPLNIYKEKTKGCLPGESSCFFVLENEKQKQSYAKLLDVEMVFRADNLILAQKLSHLLKRHQLGFEDIDLVLGGFNSDPEYDMQIDNFIEEILPNASVANYKHLCGEHDTSSAFAMWLASIILKDQDIPKSIIRTKKRDITEIKNILVYQNNYIKGNNHGFILLQKV